MVSIKNLLFGYVKDKRVLNQINLEVHPNEIVGLLGANGSGKTTAFKLLAGLLIPDDGEITIDGISTQTDMQRIKQKSAFVPDESLLYPTLTGEENLNMFALLWGIKDKSVKQKAAELLKQFGLFDVKNKWVKSYSRGMTQKLSICAALIHNPSLLLMDEPFSGIDISALQEVREILKQFSLKENNVIIFTSHTPEIIESLATRVIILHNGTIVKDFVNDRTTQDSLIRVYHQATK